MNSYVLMVLMKSSNQIFIILDCLSGCHHFLFCQVHYLIMVLCRVMLLDGKDFTCDIDVSSLCGLDMCSAALKMTIYIAVKIAGWQHYKMLILYSH
jgi:phage-related holin